VTVALVIAALYVASAAYAYWFLVSTSKVGMRPTRSDIIETVRREGWTLVLMCLGWLPILVVGFVTEGIRARRENRHHG
jgi:hypothetical protein